MYRAAGTASADFSEASAKGIFLWSVADCAFPLFMSGIDSVAFFFVSGEPGACEPGDCVLAGTEN